MSKIILIVTSHLWVWWGTENSSVVIWESLKNIWYKVLYFTCYDTKNKYQVSWEEICLKEKITSNKFYLFFK